MKRIRRFLQWTDSAYDNAPFGKRLLVDIVSISLALIVSALILWVTFTFIVPHGAGFVRVDGSSMDPTLHDGQVLFYDSSPICRGDIITFTIPEPMLEHYPSKKGVVLIKRVVGVPGDTIRFEGNDIYVNDVLFEESYLSEEAKQYNYVEKMATSYVCAEGQYFLLGDNREVSFDSRYFGIVDAEYLVSKISFTITVGTIPYILLLTAVISICVGFYSITDPYITYLFLLRGKHMDDEQEQSQPEAEQPSDDL